MNAGANSLAAREVGRRVRERRIAIGLTQAQLGAPLTRAFVSAVEQGHALPSLGALWLFAARLGVGVGSLVEGVNGVVTPEYTAVDVEVKRYEIHHLKDRHDASPSGRR